MRTRSKTSLIVVAALVAALLPVALLAEPSGSTPAGASPVSPVCGVANAATISQPSQPPPSNTVSVFAAGQNVSALATEGTNLYVLNSVTRTVGIYNVNGSAAGGFTVPWSVGSPLAVDSSGNIYLFRIPRQLVKLSATGVELWSVNVSVAVDGLFVIGTGTSQLVGATRTGTSTVLYTQAGVAAGTSPVLGSVFSSTSDGGVVATDGKYVTRYSSGGAVQTQFGDPHTFADQLPTGGPYHFYQQGGAAAGPDGTVYIADATRGIHATTASGFYKGFTDELTLGYVTERAGMVIVGTRLYFAAGGRFNANQHVSSIALANLDTLVATPKAPDPILGFGAGLSSPAVGQYFPTGQAPSVSASFDPWWTRVSSGLSLQYSVRERKQVMAGQAVTATSIPLPTSAAALANLPLSLPPARPGAYEIDARVVNQSGTALGSTCFRYTVGAPGARLDFATLPPGSGFGGPTPVRGVALADQLGVKSLRLSIDWSKLLPNIDGPMDFSTHDDIIRAAAQEAKNRGVTLFVLVGLGLGKEQSLVAQGTWEQRVRELVTHFAGVVPYWEAWSEPNNNYRPAPDYVANVLAPFARAVRAADPAAKVIGGTTLRVDPSYWQGIIAAGGLPSMDVAAIHPYSGHGRSWEEQGIPRSIGQLKQILTNAGAASMEIWNTEMAWWTDGPGNYYPQADKIARSMLWNRMLGVARWSYLLLEAGYGDYGLTYSFIESSDKPDYVKPSALASMTVDSRTASRPFLGAVATGIPHTYGALFGAAPGSSTNVLVTWSDAMSVTSNLTSDQNVSATVTDVLGDSSPLSLAAGQPVPFALSASPQYIEVPATAHLQLASPEPFGTDLIVAGQATATASSSNPSSSPQLAIDGLSDANDGNDIPGLPAWASAPGDAAPVLTVTLPQAQVVDRVVVTAHSNSSVLTGLRNYAVAVQATDGSWNTVGTITDQFFDRNNIVSFSARSITGVRVSTTLVNYSGYIGGSSPWFWPLDPAALNDNSSPWYGPAIIYEVEAFAPQPAQIPQPPAAPTGVTAQVNAGAVDVSWSASPGASSYRVERSVNGSAFAVLTTTTQTTYKDTAVAAGSTYTYRVVASNAAGSSAPSASASATLAPPAPTGLSAQWNGSAVVLTWSASSGTTSYRIERSVDGGLFATRATVTSTTYTDTSVTNGSRYSYRVVAKNAGGDSARSGTASITIPPRAPNNLRVTSTANSQIALAWNNTPSATSYTVERSTNNVNFSSIAVVTTATYTDATVAANVTYYYRVRATNAGGTSNPSNTVTAQVTAGPN